MKIDRISFTTSIPVAMYGIKDVMSAEATVEEHEDWEEAFRGLVAFVENMRNEKYPHIYGINKRDVIEINGMVYSGPVTSSPIVNINELSGPFTLEEEITNCKDLENLKSCHFLIKATKDEVLKRKLLLLYDTKLEILKKQTELAR